MEKKIPVYISLGSNCGDAKKNLDTALKELRASTKGSLEDASYVYQTEPQGDKEQTWFHNQVVRFDYIIEIDPNNTESNAEDKIIEKEACSFLDDLLMIENKMGRVRDKSRRFGPRIIDLDIILFGNYHFKSEKLTVPHPRFLERAFILIPLQEIEQGTVLSKTQIENALALLPYTLSGTKIYQ